MRQNGDAGQNRRSVERSASGRVGTHVRGGESQTARRGKIRLEAPMNYKVDEGRDMCMGVLLCRPKEKKEHKQVSVKEEKEGKKKKKKGQKPLALVIMDSVRAASTAAVCSATAA